MPKVPYPYEANGKLVTGNGFLIPICSLSNSFLMPSLTVVEVEKYLLFSDCLWPYCEIGGQNRPKKGPRNF